MRGERVNEERQVESIAQTGEKIRRCFLDFPNPPEEEQRSEGLKTVFGVTQLWRRAGMKGRRPADLRGSAIVGAAVDVTVFRKASSNHGRPATKISPPTVAHFGSYRFCVKRL